MLPRELSRAAIQSRTCPVFVTPGDPAVDRQFRATQCFSFLGHGRSPGGGDMRRMPALRGLLPEFVTIFAFRWTFALRIEYLCARRGWRAFSPIAAFLVVCIALVREVNQSRTAS